MSWMKCTAWAVLAGSISALTGCARGPATVEAAEEPRPVAPAPQALATQAKTGKPADRGTALAREALAPSDPSNARADVTSSPRRKPAREPQEPAILPPAAQPSPHGVPAKAGKTARPTLLDEPAPLFDQLEPPRLPEPPHLAVGPRVRIDSPDVNQPIPLPLLAQPILERVALDDPTLDASTAAALAQTPPARTTPWPFVRLVLANPFEHRESGRLRNPPEENTMPVIATPRVPGK